MGSHWPQAEGFGKFDTPQEVCVCPWPGGGTRGLGETQHRSDSALDPVSGNRTLAEWLWLSIFLSEDTGCPVCFCTEPQCLLWHGLSGKKVWGHCGGWDCQGAHTGTTDWGPDLPPGPRWPQPWPPGCCEAAPGRGPVALSEHGRGPPPTWATASGCSTSLGATREGFAQVAPRGGDLRWTPLPPVGL